MAGNNKSKMANTNKTPPDLLDLYGYVLEYLKYEGAGIWSRFNIMIGLNITLFGLWFLIVTYKLNNKFELAIIIGIGGFLFSIWAIYVSHRLWAWHYHWVNIAQIIEERFPNNLPRPFQLRPTTLQRKKNSRIQLWFKSYTQPFFVIVAAIWLIIVILPFYYPL